MKRHEDQADRIDQSSPAFARTSSIMASIALILASNYGIRVTVTVMPGTTSSPPRATLAFSVTVSNLLMRSFVSKSFAHCPCRSALLRRITYGIRGEALSLSEYNVQELGLAHRHRGTPTPHHEPDLGSMRIRWPCWQTLATPSLKLPLLALFFGRRAYLQLASHQT